MCCSLIFIHNFDMIQIIKEVLLFRRQFFIHCLCNTTIGLYEAAKCGSPAKAGLAVGLRAVSLSGARC